MSNLRTALLAIEAELAYTRQGLAYYRSRVEALEAALAKLDNVEGREESAAAASGARHSPARRKEASGADMAGDDLPRTSKEFWLGLIGEAPLSFAEIQAAAVRTLGIEPSARQSRKLAQRQANILSVLTRTGAVSSSGSGRARRFFRSA